MLVVDPPDHTRLRRLTARAFSRRRVDGLERRVRAIVAQLLDGLAARGDEVVDLVADYAFPMPFTVMSELLGIPEPDRADLGRWFRTLLAPHSWPPPVETVAASEAIIGYLAALLDHKRAEPDEDLVTDLVVAGDAITRQEAMSTIFQLVVAGYDTTTSLTATRPLRCSAIRRSATPWSPTPHSCRAPSRRPCAGTRRGSTRRSATPPRTSASATS